MRRFLPVVLLMTLALAAHTWAADETRLDSTQFLQSPHYVMELPYPLKEGDVARGEKILLVLERLATRLDNSFVDAGALRKKALPKRAVVERYENKGPRRLEKRPKKPVLWSVRLERTREAMASVCEPLLLTVNRQGTAYYNNGNQGFLGVVSVADDEPGIAELLSWGTAQYLFQRAGIYYNRTVSPRGACVVEGLKHFMKWSHVQGEDLPRELGGIGSSYSEQLRQKMQRADGGFPRLEELFDATPAVMDKDSYRLYGTAVLFTEFLWDHSPESRRAYIPVLVRYGASGSPVRVFSLDTLLKGVRKVFGSKKKLQTEFETWVLEKSEAVNRRKASGE